ncbi:MAG: hypothetical protein RLZZ339_3293, partial [Cyanobacteriota bacterium]
MAAPYSDDLRQKAVSAVGSKSVLQKSALETGRRIEENRDISKEETVNEPRKPEKTPR